MSSFPGRRGQGVNMSQYIQNLNEIPKDSPPKEQATTLEDDLAMFTNTSFTDWDATNHPGASPVGSSSHGRRKSSVAQPAQPVQPAGPMPTADAMGDIENFEFHLDGYGFDFTPYAPSAVPAFAESIGSLQPIQPTPAYNNGPNQQRPPYVTPQPPQSGEKRKSESHIPQQPRMSNFEDQSRVAAEEDKRRRNTAASARFRVKKKAREQALEKSQKELGDKVSSLESRIHSLETENKWLRELIMDKNGGNESAVNMLLDGRREKEAKLAAS